MSDEVSDKIKVLDLGVMAYREAWDLQKQYFNRLIENPDAEEVLILVEHRPVYTLGFHGNERNLLVDTTTLESRGAECIRIERGGDITYHGPGQLVVYPIINLHKHHLGVKQYVEILEKSVRELIKEYGIESTSNKDAIGVWIDWATAAERKICAIGVKVSHGITMHGLALNVNTDLSAFGLINPCGFAEKGVTSMAEELGHTVDIQKVKDRLTAILMNNIDSKLN